VILRLRDFRGRLTHVSAGRACDNPSTATAERPETVMSRAGSDEPVDIRYDNARGRLEISWADGAEGVYGYEFLRWHCPCAACAGEMGQPGQLEQVEHLNPEQYALRTIEPVGLYALRPTWADGHDSGIFTFERLRALTAAAAADLHRPEPATRRPAGDGDP
jgi:DUF971 family protein